MGPQAPHSAPRENPATPSSPLVGCRAEGLIPSQSVQEVERLIRKSTCEDISFVQQCNRVPHVQPEGEQEHVSERWCDHNIRYSTRNVLTFFCSSLSSLLIFQLWNSIHNQNVRLNEEILARIQLPHNFHTFRNTQRFFTIVLDITHYLLSFSNFPTPHTSSASSSRKSSQFSVSAAAFTEMPFLLYIF